MAALADADFERRNLEAFRAPLPRFVAGLQPLGLEVLPSADPFVPALLPRPCGTAGAHHLRPQDILVRTCRDWPGLGDRCFRPAVKAAEAQDRLPTALSSLLSKP